MSLELEKEKIKAMLLRFARFKNINSYSEINAEPQAEYLSEITNSVEVAKALKKLLPREFLKLDIAYILEFIPQPISAELLEVITCFNKYYAKKHGGNSAISKEQEQELQRFIDDSTTDVVCSKIKEFYTDCDYLRWNDSGNNYWFVKGEHDFNIKNFIAHFDEISTHEDDRHLLFQSRDKELAKLTARLAGNKNMLKAGE